MLNFIITKIFGAVGKRLDGYKTKIGGVGSILIGLAGVVRLLFPDMTTLPDLGFEASAGFIVGGFTALGIGGKMEKQKVATVATGIVQNKLLIAQNKILSETAPEEKKAVVAELIEEAHESLKDISPKETRPY